MQALKDILELQGVLGDNPITASPLWNMPVDTIAPVQLMAFRTKMKLRGQTKQADATIEFVMRSVEQALDGKVKMLDYKEPNESSITSVELVNGFETMTRPMPAAILFGLETRMRPDEVTTLTWARARKLMWTNKISSYAKNIIRSQPHHIHCKYVFWQQNGTKTDPVFGIEQEVFDTFGRTWEELQNAYERLVLTIH